MLLQANDAKDASKPPEAGGGPRTGSPSVLERRRPRRRLDLRLLAPEQTEDAILLSKPPHQLWQSSLLKSSRKKKKKKNLAGDRAHRQYGDTRALQLF